MKRALVLLWLWGTALMSHGQTVDLRSWQPATNPRQDLATGWQFAYGTFSDSARFQPIAQLASWDQLAGNGDMMLSEHGCGTYRLHLRLPETQEQLGILMPFVWTAYRMTLNGQVVAQSGTPACDPADHRPMMLRELVLIPQGTRELTLTLQVADHDFFFAGMVEPPIIGRYESLSLDRAFNNAINLAVMGGLLVMAVYHFLIYAFRRKERAMRSFGFICLAVTLRFAVFGDHYLYEWLNQSSGFFSFGIQVRVYYLMTVVLVWLGMDFFRELFPQDTWRLPGRIYVVLTGLFTLWSLVVPLAWFTASLLVAQVVMGIGVAYLVYVLLRAAVHNRPEARAMLLGLGLMVLAGIHDVLQLAGIYLLAEVELLTFGFVGFLVVQFVVLSRRYSSTFNEVEDLNANLEQKVEQRTEELRLANEDIARKNQDITDSIEYAKRIQLSILPKSDAFYARFPDSFVYYQAKDIVSGDFYWFRDDGDRFLLAAADCTGHGVPGAFMSVLGSNLLHRITARAQHEPVNILTELHAGVVEALRQEEKGQSQDGMDMALVSIEGSTLTYAGANRPLWVVRGHDLVLELQPTKHPIGGSAETAGAAEFHQHRLDLQPGDCIYLFTDGVTDQFGGENKRKYSTKRLKQRLTELHDLSMNQQHSTLHHELHDWRGQLSQTDDMLLIGIRYYQ